MKTKQEIIEVVADYRPRITWDLYTFMNPERNENLDLEKANEYFAKFIVEIKGRTPEEDTLDYITWYYDGKIAEIVSRDGKGPIEESDEMFHFQVGTSKTRAEHFLKYGGGYVKLENMIGKKSWNLIDKFYGLQVSELKKGAPRSGFARLKYYAEMQGIKNCGDKPCVLIGSIPKKYVYGEHNEGEFAISKKDHNKIQNAEILSLQEYYNRFEEKPF